MNNLNVTAKTRKVYLRMLIDHFIKYSFVGIANLLFTLILYIIFLYKLDFRYELAFTLSWLAGVLFTYVINFLWVFKPEEKITFKKRLPKYFLVYLSSYFLNMFLLTISVYFFSIDPLVSQIFILPVIVIINFAGIKYWALR